MLSVENTALLVVDMQVKLTRTMTAKESLVINLQKLIAGMKVLGVPVIFTEQYPQGLGSTIPEIASLLNETKPITKMSFSCCGNEDFLQKVKSLNRKQIIIAGIEAHVCVYQTVCDLLTMGYEVQAVADCVSSRTLENRAIALDKMRDNGAQITSVESVLFELLKTAESKLFKEISGIVK
jgi:nicotinamidase-related amidase